LQVLDSPGDVDVTIRTDAGIDGHGACIFGRVAGAARSLAALIENELKGLVVGTDPVFVRRTHAAMLRQTEYHGSGGLTMFAVATLDTALWDCLGHARGVPCWQLWGACREMIPAYAMVGWLNYTDDEAQEICAKAASQGFRAVKVKVPCASHGGGPVQLSIMAALPNAFYVETGVLDPGSPLELVDGCARLPRGAGFSWE